MSHDAVQSAPWNAPQWRVPGTTPGCPHGPLPMSRAEMDALGWEACDIVLVTGDAYIDHPSFGVPVIGRVLAWLGYRVGIIAQPQSVEAMRALGRPALCWGISAGNVDSALMRQTIMRRPRRDDDYTPGGQAGARPANATIVYATLARQAYKGVPVIIGGVEASLRRFAYYDYWTDKVKRSLLLDAKADLLVHGMGERAMAIIAHHLREGVPLTGIPGTTEVRRELDAVDAVILPPFATVAAPDESGKTAFAEMARLIHAHTSTAGQRILAQQHGDRWVVVHPAQLVQPAELDALYALPFTRHPHPCYGDAHIPAFAMIQHSVTTHRGCYAGCSFCAIGAHQGTTITSRSPENVLGEIERVAADRDFHGTISDLGGPTANMYGTGCAAGGCARRACLYPNICRHLRADHRPVIHLLRAARAVAGVKHVFVTSGIRCDLAMSPGGRGYLRELAAHHVCGRLKIAPEHIVPGVLKAMRKFDADLYRRFTAEFHQHARQHGKPHQVTEYFMSGHPGCTLDDMIELARYLRAHRIAPEQVQDFYPAPLTLAAAMFYTGRDPLTGKAIHVARDEQEKAWQRALLLSHKPEFQRKAREALRAAGREELIGFAPTCLVPPEPGASDRGRPARARRGR